MASKGNDRHMKALESPTYLGIHRKASKYIMKTRAGRHSMDRSLPMAVFLKKEGLVDSTADAKKVLSDSKVKVNGKVIRDVKYPIGLSDVITVGDAHYVVGINENAKAVFSKTEKHDEATYKLIRKYKDRKGKLMFGLHDGSVVPGSADAKVNDSICIGSDRKIRKVLRLEKGAKCVVIAGVNVGIEGKVEDIKEGNMHSPKSITVSSKQGTFETIVKNVMVTQ